MKLPKLSMPFLLILFLLYLGGCAPITPHTGGEIGVLRVSGPNVLLNGSPASDGEPVRLGNSVTTGPGSSAMVEFTGGGYLQLDQNTDPIFEWLEQSKCILIRIFKGQAYLKKEQACVEGPNIAMVLNSEINLRVESPPATTEVTVIRGSVEVTKPEAILLIQNQQLLVAEPRRALAVRTVSPAALRSLVAWRKDFRFAPLRPRTEPPVILLPPRSPREPREPRRGDEAAPGGPTAPPETRPTIPPPVLERPGRIPGTIERPIDAPVVQPPEPVIR